MRPSPFAPKKPGWLWISVLVSGVAIAGFAWGNAAQPWRPGRFGGLFFGIAASLLFLNAACYPARRRLRTRPWRTAQQWLQLHIYGSTIALLFVFLHTGFRWPAGTLGWWLLALSVWTTLTGLMGVAIQKWLPVRMSRALRVEAVFERIADLRAQVLARADEIIQGAPTNLERVYGGQVRPVLAAAGPRWSYVLDPRSGHDRQLAPLRAVVGQLQERDRARAEALEALIVEKLELDAHLSLQRVLRMWTYVHVPPAMLLMALLGVHVAAVLLY